MRRYLILLILISLISVAGAQGEEVNVTDALNAISQSEKDMQEMAEAGFGVLYVNDTLTEAKKALELANCSLVIEKTRDISNRKQRAYEIRDFLRALELRIEDIRGMGLETARAEELLSSALTAFQEENYGEAEELVFQANKDLSNVEAEHTLLKATYTAARENLVSYIKEHRQDIGVSITGAIFLGLILYNRVTRIRTKGRLEDMKLEMGVLEDLMKKAQKEHFKKGTMPRETYEIKMEKYRERMLEIKRTIPVLEAKLGKKSEIKEVEKEK